MALEGETVGFGTVVCPDCGKTMPLEVCVSAAGYYLGHCCGECGPYTRETVYMSEPQAEELLRQIQEESARSECPKCHRSLQDVKPEKVDIRRNAEAEKQYGNICLEWSDLWTCPACEWAWCTENANY